MFATKSGALVSSSVLKPHDVTSGVVELSDLHFSPDGRQIAALVTGVTVPIYRFWVRTGQEVPVSAPVGASPGQWGSVVRDTPAGLSPNLNMIIQTNSTDPNTVGVGYVESNNFIEVHFTESPAFSFTGPAPAVTSDSRLLLMPYGDGAVPVFDLSQRPRSHFARISSVNNIGA